MKNGTKRNEKWERERSKNEKEKRNRNQERTFFFSSPNSSILPILQRKCTLRTEMQAESWGERKKRVGERDGGVYN